MEIRQLRLFVAVVDDGGITAAARRLHMSQSAVSQTILALEHELGVILLERTTSGVAPTAAGDALLTHAREWLHSHEQTLRVMARFRSPAADFLSVGIPLELAPHVMPTALARFVERYPDRQIRPRHLSSAQQIAALQAGELDVGFVRERSDDTGLDSLLVAREDLGVLIDKRCAPPPDAPQEIALEDLHPMTWLGFPRADSPAWHDEVTSILRGHGITVSPQADFDHPSIAPVKLAGVAGGHSFALAPRGWLEVIPSDATWVALTGSPIQRRTWVMWPAESRRRDVAELIAAMPMAPL